MVHSDPMDLDISANSGVGQGTPEDSDTAQSGVENQDLAWFYSSMDGPETSAMSSDINMGSMMSALNQSSPEASSGGAVTFVYGPSKVGRPKTKPPTNPLLLKRPVGRPTTKAPQPSSSKSGHPLPPLRDPSAPRGPTYKSLTQWLQSQPHDTQMHSMTNTSSISSPPVRVIIAEPDEDAVVVDDDVFYSQVQNFWLPQKAGWFQMLQARTLGPEALYNPRWFYWDPLELVKIKCPNYSSCQSFLARNTIWKCPQRCVDLDSCFWMIGARYKCTKCHNEKSGKKDCIFHELGHPYC